MVKGYLIGEGNFFSKWNNNYKIYFPENNKVLGYFKNRDLEFSDNMFYDFVSLDDSRKLSGKINRGKFFGEVEVNDRLLEDLTLFNRHLSSVEGRVNVIYSEIENSLNTKSQK